MKKVQLVFAIALIAILAGCASHQYTRDDMTDKRAFKRQLKIDNRLCKADSAYDACMLAHGWHRRNPGEARFHPAPAASATSAAQAVH
ncbi:MAG: hypothetical protein LBH31_08555 [Burkholderiaceae bacterium]|jgi:hypothetical protein|nr:hypothetical protein [Burkholderiaceae bacterium]